MEDKRGFLMYADYISIFEELEDSEAGQLIKHVFRYVNDLNPESENRLIKIAFSPIKQQLKRDLLKWSGILKKRSNAGKKSAQKRKQKTTNPTSVESVQHSSTNPTVTVNVNDNVINKENIQKKISFDQSEIFDKAKFMEAFSDWPVEKLKHYYEAADRWSTEKHKYVNWKKAIAGWASKDDLKGTFNWDKKQINTQETIKEREARLTAQNHS